LKPTLNGNTEVIVVAHEQQAGGAVSQAATAAGARAISYQGAFHFGFMNGQGAQAATGSVILFMNDDVFPVAPDWLDRMAAHLAQAHVGVVGALLLYPSQKIQHAGVVVGGHLGPTHIGRFLRESALWPWLKITREVTAVTGACLAIRREVWDELGGFDPRFPVNYNDTDLCLRARRLSYRVILEADAVLIHEESQSRNPRVRPEEFALFTSLWSDVLEAADPYFHPALVLADRDIHFRSPWNRLK
jgi:GT2 family glycosyltransferase